MNNTRKKHKTLSLDRLYQKMSSGKSWESWPQTSKHLWRCLPECTSKHITECKYQISRWKVADVDMEEHECNNQHKHTKVAALHSPPQPMDISYKSTLLQPLEDVEPAHPTAAYLVRVLGLAWRRFELQTTSHTRHEYCTYVSYVHMRTCKCIYIHIYIYTHTSISIYTYIDTHV